MINHRHGHEHLPWCASCVEREDQSHKEPSEANDLVEIAATGREEQVQGEDDQPRDQDRQVWEQGSRTVQQSRGVHACLLILRSSSHPGGCST